MDAKFTFRLIVMSLGLIGVLFMINKLKTEGLSYEAQQAFGVAPEVRKAKVIFKAPSKKAKSKASE